jgi:hypothetical protein
MINDDLTIKNTPTHVSTQEDLKNSYNQFMSMENSPEEKAKMDKMMANLVGIDVGSSDSSSTPTKKKQIKRKKKKAKHKDEDRKLVGDDTHPHINEFVSNPDLGNMKDDFAADNTMPSTMPKDGRKLNFNGGMEGNMEGDMGMNTDLANMKNSFDNMNSMAPGTEELDMDTGSDTIGGLDSGLHADATKAIINRMDETNQERMQKLNSMFPPPSKLMAEPRKKKNSHIISIKKMLKGYPSELVRKFMPELKDRVMHKFNELKKARKEKSRIRRLKKKLMRTRRREKRRRRKLREKRRRKRRRMRIRAERRRKRRNHMRFLKHFRPHFSMHMHHLKERRLENQSVGDSQNTSNNTDDPYMDLQNEINQEMASTNSQNTPVKGIRLVNLILTK